ncbi:sulfate/molybdate ABC transporter ATP-binding protein [Natranaerofaba carboxydovora]|uniref:sulfate/molybdate ABC transporter ATP-binding protein n=1 Tax=Natranaerofaba carboxydovora TaxID=2742683 RepID=UPI001F1402C1|nr:ABC transporter ATP-binding protein [Natranaerofaba carboxydovora]UMZ73152.1 Sulfate/thiosulfate import ATP-binding protein CysA [Natranaerofaba carboxydovora]
MLNCNIKKTYENFELDIDLNVEGGITALFGPSGCGKSLTLRCISGLTEPEEGQVNLNNNIFFDKEKSINTPVKRRNIGFLFQDYALFPHLTVEKNIGFGLKNLSKSEKKEKVNQMLKIMRLDNLGKRYPSQLSGGQKQRVALARTLVVDPDLLLLDEPFSALDAPVRKKMQEELLTIHNKFPVTTLLVTHSLEEAFMLSDNIAVMDDGKILQMGPKEKVLNEPSCRTVARFTGNRNIFSGKIISKEDDHAKIKCNGLILKAPNLNYNLGESVNVSIRPTEVLFVRQDLGKRGLNKDNVFEGTLLDKRIEHSTSYTLFLKLFSFPQNEDDYDLEIHVSLHIYNKLKLASESNVYVTLPPESLSIFKD